MRLVTVKIPEVYVEGLDELVKMGRYSGRSEAIRVAIRELLRKEHPAFSKLLLSSDNTASSTTTVKKVYLSS